jgi:hypothetical protein
MGWPNGHWAHNWGQAVNLYYSRGCAGNFYWQAGDAAANWTSTPTRIWFWEVGAPPCNGNAYDGYVDIYSYNDPNSWAWGYAQAYTKHCFLSWCWLDPSWNETYNSGIVQLNNAKTPGAPYCMLVADVTHELGHDMGLAHAGFYNGEGTGNYSIMDYLTWDCNPWQPTAHDSWDLNQLYP